MDQPSDVISLLTPLLLQWVSPIGHYSLLLQ